MDSTKDKLKKVLDYIIERKDDQAKLELQKIKEENPKWVTWKKALKEYGLDYEIVSVPEKTFDDLQEVLKPYHKNARLKIIDDLYMMVAKNE